MHYRSPMRLAALLPLVLAAACAPDHAGPPPSVETATYRAPDLPPEPRDLASVTEPSRLRGLSPVQVRTLLGDPGFLRRDTPAEIWQYRVAACTLDLFIYDGRFGQHVTHYAVRSQNAMGEKACFDEVLRENRGQPSS